MRKIFCKVVLFIACALSFVSCGSSATADSYFEFTRVEDGYSIKLAELPDDGIIHIPSSYKGKKVVEISERGFENQDELIEVTIPSSVTRVGDLAFSSCSSLIHISIPNTIESIGEDAFTGCSVLKNAAEYGNCLYLGNASNPYVVLFRTQNDSIKEATVHKDTRVIMDRAFSDCSSLSLITFEEGSKLVSIEDFAFQYCKSLTSITFPDQVTHLGGFLFFGSSSLTSIEIPNSITSIEYGLITESGPIKFNQKGSSIYLGNKENPYLVLVEEQDLTITKTTIDENTRIILEGAYGGCASLTSIFIPNHIYWIGESAFSGCESLTSVTFERECKLKRIIFHTFAKCSSLTSISIPSSVTYIEEFAFQNCEALTTVKIPDNLRIIDSNVFSECVSLNSINIPNSVTSIGHNAFINCDSLTSIVIPKSVTFMGYRAFALCDLLSVFCEADSQPSEWDSLWNSSNRPVYWKGQWSYVRGVPTPK